MSSRARVDRGGQVGEREGDALVVDDRRAERFAPVGVLGGVFHCGPGDSERLRGDHRPGLLERAHGGRAGMPGALDRPRAPWRACARASPGRRAGCSPGTRTPLNFSSAVCDARQPSLSSLRTISRPGVPPGTMNRACPRWPSSSSTTALTTCTLAMPPLPIHILWPSMIQSSPSRRRAPVRRLRTSLPPSGSEIASAASLRSPGVPKHSGAHSQHLLGRSRLADRRQRQRGHHDRQPDAGAAPEQLLHEHRQRQPGRIADQIAVEQRAVETPRRPPPRAPATGTPGAAS